MRSVEVGGVPRVVGDGGTPRRGCLLDLDGGTFDVPILEIGDGVFEVKSTHGDVSRCSARRFHVDRCGETRSLRQGTAGRQADDFEWSRRSSWQPDPRGARVSQ